MMMRMTSAVCVAALTVGMVSAAMAQVTPCPDKTAQNYDRGTDPRAVGGGQTAQNYDRGTDPRAVGGGQTAQNYDRGTDPRAAGQTAHNYDRGTDPREAGFGRTDAGSSAGAGHAESASVDPSGVAGVQTADSGGCR